MIAKTLPILLAALLLPLTGTTRALAQETTSATHGVGFASAASAEISTAPALGPVPAPTGTSSFTGITLADQLNQLAQSAWPASPCIAVGPTHVVEVMNQSMAIYSRTGTRLSHVRLRDFLRLVVGNVTYQATFDPKIIYDIRSSRFFLACVSSGAGQTGQGDPVLLAVSKTSDPTKGWATFVLPVGTPPVGGNFFSTGNLTLGVDGNGLYLGLRVFPDTGAAYGKIIATRKSTLIAATLHQFTNLSGILGSPHPATSLDATATGDPAWFAASLEGTMANVRMWKVTWSGNTPALSSAFLVTTPAYGANVTVPQKDSATPFNVSENYLLSAVLSKGHLWTCRTVGTNATGTAASPTRNAAEWLDLSVTGVPGLTQSGRIYDPDSTARSYCAPSIGVNPSGHVLLSMLGSSASGYLSAYFTGRENGDAPGTMGPVQLLKAGETTYVRTVGGSINPIGRYGSVCLDPLDNFSLWTVQSFAFDAPPVVGEAWGTWIARVGFSNPPGTIAVSPSALDFKNVKLKKSKTLGFTLTSSGTGPLKGSVGKPTGPYTITSGGGSFTLAPGAKKTIKVKFTPTKKGRKTASIKITTNDLTKPAVTINLTGKGQKK